MKLYSYQPSPFGSRVRLAMHHKGLPFEVASPIEVDPQLAPFLAKSPMEVPTLLLDGGIAISGSAAILDYLEDAYPSPSLRPAEPEQLALARMLLQVPDTYMQDAPRRLFGMANPAERDEQAADQQFEQIATALEFVDYRIDGGPWAVGGRVSIADCGLLPVLSAISLLSAIHARPDVIARHHNVASYWHAAQADTVNAKLLEEQRAGLPAGLREIVRA